MKPTNMSCGSLPPKSFSVTRPGMAMTIPARGLYSPWQPEQVEFVLAKETHLRQVAEACGSYYKLLRRLNPRLRTATLPPGMYKTVCPGRDRLPFL